MDTEMLEMLEMSLERVLTESSDRPLERRLDDLGWREVVTEDAATALRSLFAVKGRTLASSDALGPRLAGALADALDAPEISAATIALPASLHPDRRSSSLDGSVLEVSGLALSAPAEGAPMVVPADGDGGVRLAVVVPDGDVSFRPVGGIDPDLGLVHVDATVAAARISWCDGDTEDAWDAAIALGRWALASEMVGIGNHVITQAVSYARERKQYGRAIGSFQAVQHRLASAYASVTGASSVVAEAAASGSPWVAKVVKALAGRAAEDSCTQAQQTYGAIGFTWEHEFHRYLRRTYVLDRLLGDWRTLEHEIGAHLQATRAVPRIGAL